jgi:hypothetical protein
MFEQWSHFVAVFAGFVLVGMVIYLLGSRKARAEAMKKEAYTCGEKLPRTYVGPENFYEALKENLKLNAISKLHSGRLSDYLLWLVVGLSAILITVLLL